MLEFVLSLLVYLIVLHFLFNLSAFTNLQLLPEGITFRHIYLLILVIGIILAYSFPISTGISFILIIVSIGLSLLGYYY